MTIGNRYANDQMLTLVGKNLLQGAATYEDHCKESGIGAEQQDGIRAIQSHQ